MNVSHHMPLGILITYIRLRDLQRTVHVLLAVVGGTVSKDSVVNLLEFGHNLAHAHRVCDLPRSAIGTGVIDF